MMPLARMDWASSASVGCSLDKLRGRGLASMDSMSTCKALAVSRSWSWPCCGGGEGAGVMTRVRVGSRAPKPLPRALRELSGLFMVQNFFGKLNVTLGAAGPRVIDEDRLAETGGFGQPDAARNDSLKD